MAVAGIPKTIDNDIAVSFYLLTMLESETCQKSSVKCHHVFTIKLIP